MKSNPVLKTLEVSYNNIGNSGAAAIRDALKSNTALKTLYLHNNNVTCGIHGTQRTSDTVYIVNNGDPSRNVARRSIFKCPGLWSSDFRDTDVRGKTALAAVFSVVAVVALVWFVRRVGLHRKRTERAVGQRPVDVHCKRTRCMGESQKQLLKFQTALKNNRKRMKYDRLQSMLVC